MKKILTLTVLVLLLSGCGTSDDDSTDSENDHDKNTSENVDRTIAEANNQLGFELLKMVEPDEAGNIFISPTSLFMALSMLYTGAEAETKQEIADTLQLTSIEVDQLNQANASLIALINDDSREVELDIGNSIWLNEQFQFQTDFADNNQTYFNAEIAEIDVADDGSVDQINAWVKEATNDKIDGIASAPLDPNLVTMLINAIYFKGSWTYPFDESDTAKHPFHLEDGSTKDVALMKLGGNFSYLENDNFQAISLPYGENEEMSMQIFLPNKDSNITDFQAGLMNADWEDWRTEFRSEEGMIKLPKFELEYETSLNGALQELGMVAAFDENEANFEKMIEEDIPVWISEVKQKTFIDVNEEGTEAAGVTSIEMRTTSAPADPPFEMRVDRPFFLTITDEESGLILFMGTILNP